MGTAENLVWLILFGAVVVMLLVGATAVAFHAGGPFVGGVAAAMVIIVLYRLTRYAI